MVIGDGEANDKSFLKTVIDRIVAEGKVRVSSIRIGDKPNPLYPVSVNIATAEALGPSLVGQLASGLAASQASLALPPRGRPGALQTLPVIG